jgi:nitroreductase
MQNFLELIKKRYSVRDYLDKQVEKDKLELILEAGRLAPSACNLQPWHFWVIQDKETLNKIKSVYKREWLQKAPAIVVICGDHTKSWKRADGKDHCDIDVAITVDHMTLQAAELGIGSCWICMFDAIKCAEILELPEHIEPIVLLPLGYPTNEQNERHVKRRPLDEVATFI